VKLLKPTKTVLNLMRTFKELLFLLPPRERKYIVPLVIMIIIMSLLDTIGIASIMPFITVLVNPGHIETNIMLNTVFQASGRLGIETKQERHIHGGTLTEARQR
jgi:hypothetical protein